MAATRVSRRRRLIGLSVVGTLCGAFASAVTAFTDGFDAGLAAWTPIEPSRWEIRQDDGNPYAALIQPGELRPGVRRPAEYALVSGRRWRDVTITVRARSLRPSTLVGRDVVVVFGHRDDTHFYYAHLSNDSNGSTHNVIMRVDGDRRRTIQVEPKPEPRLTDGWHTIRVRHLADGAIAVWMDDLEQPLMTAVDTTYPDGAVGIGSFDDTAAFDDVEVTGESAD